MVTKTSDLFAAIDKARQLKYNLAVVSVPGMGSSHLLKNYVNDHPEVKYINKPGDTLGNFNILDLAFDLNPNALQIASDYFHQASSGQAIALAVNTPYIFEFPDYQNSFVKAHIYQTFWLKTLNLAQTSQLIKDMGTKVSKTELNNIFTQTGGLPQLVKYFLVGDQSLISSVLNPILSVINRCSTSDLEKLGLVQDGKFISNLLFTNHSPNSKIDIKIKFDLTFSENGELNPNSLTPIEASILKKMILDDGQINKESVSAIKWGEGKYDEYSDQAINKTMRRLSANLTKYQIITIPKVGFKIITQS